MINKKKIAVFFGGRSPEHDVSVITGLQVLQALDVTLYDPFPVYISTQGSWYIGDALKKRENFLPDEALIKQLTEVTLDVSGKRGGSLIPKKQPLFGAGKPIAFDVAIPAFHGLYGEDGNIQGAFELANTPYIGMRTKASALLMDKVTSKYIFQSLGIPVLPFAAIKRPAQGYLIPEEELEKALKPLGYPCILKPSHLGSSIGVAKVNNAAEAKACLPAIFEFDDCAIAEPFVKNLVEYNVAVTKVSGGKITTSAIERPKTSDELLDFKQKYMSGGDNKGGTKMGGSKTFSPASEGMLSLTRDINPDIPAKMDEDIRKWASVMFDGIDGTGAPRIDFIGDSKSGELWMNEVNPLPGSFGYFLWEAAKDAPILFTDLLSFLIAEAITENTGRALPRDPVPADARLLKRGM
ncbi:MAG: D-alanine--D-alanine ligase [Alphaproteobacteria bacterium]